MVIMDRYKITLETDEKVLKSIKQEELNKALENIIKRTEQHILSSIRVRPHTY